MKYSYTNHDKLPHLQKNDVLLHISFVDNIFHENPVYKQDSKKKYICSFKVRFKGNYKNNLHSIG